MFTHLPDNWKFVEFGSILDGGTRNGIYKPKQFRGSGYKMVNMGELFAYPRLRDVPMSRIQLTDDEAQRFGLRVGDLLFARRSLIAEGAGKCSIVYEIKEPLTFESSIIRARPKPKIADSMFLYYLFNSPLGSHLLDTILRQVAVAGITGTDLVKLKIPLPPLPVQRAIAGILGALDDKIELNHRTNRTIESMARAMFHQWFVMDKDKGFEEKSLDEIADFLNGLALQKFPIEEDSDYLPVIKIAQLRKNNTVGADKANTAIPPEYVIEDGDILFSWSGSLEVVVWCGGKGALNQHLFKVTSDKYPKWFYYYWTKHHLPEFQAIAAGKATTMGHIQRHHLSNARVFIPPDKKLEEMDKIMSPLLEMTINNNKESRTLMSLRDSLLPKLLSGEVSIKP
jgi:type I restriction enzyme S subunit